ncbi:MAG: lipopolysaccharide transport periplasmic protein LptA [Burkholderiales bacterium]
MRRRESEARAAVVLGTAVLCALAAPTALAERADRDQPINIESDRLVADDAKKVSTFEGHVVLIQGTLIIHADRIVVRQDDQGFQYGTATGNPATFRQKREGYDEYIDGEALKIEYDGKIERVELFDQARLRRGNSEDVRGNYISYDQKTEYFTVKSSSDASQQSRDGRVRAVIMPKKKEPEPATAPTAAPLQLKPVPTIANPRQD